MKVIEKRENGTIRVHTVNSEPSLTDQSWLEQTEVNSIISKYRKTGAITHLSKKAGQFADVSDIPDMLEAHERVTNAFNAFQELPAVIRDKFQNDPMKMIQFLNNPENNEEAIKLGLKVDPNKTDLSPEDKGGIDVQPKPVTNSDNSDKSS